MFPQRGRWPDWRLHHAQHRAGEDALRRCGGHLPDGEDVANPAAGDGPDRGEAPMTLRFASGTNYGNT